MAEALEPTVTLDSWRNDLVQTVPRVARALREAARRRQRAAQTWKPSGSRIKGMEQLLLHLDSISSAPDNSRRHRAVAMLSQRAAREFETGLEAGLSGYVAVCADAMRGVMEATDLILMFSVDVTNIDQWLDTPHAEHWKKFAPRAVRAYLHSNQVKYVNNAWATVDYRGHSLSLHVTPFRVPFVEKGLATSDMLTNDMPFWEMFFHAREMVFALDRLRDASNFSWQGVARAEDLADLRTAFERSMEMQALFVAMLEAHSKNRTGEGDVMMTSDGS